MCARSVPTTKFIGLHQTIHAKIARPGQKASTHAEKSTEDSHHETDRDQPNRIDVNARDGKIHSFFPFPRTRPKIVRVRISRANPCAIINTSAVNA